VDEEREQLLRRAVDLEVRQAAEEFAEHHGDLAAREVRAQAVVRARAAEADVEVRRAAHVELEGALEHLLVAVPRRVPEHHLLAGRDLLAAQLGVARGGAAEVDHGRRPAHDLLDRGGRDGVEVGGPDAALLGEVAERLHAVADRVARGLVARDDQQHEERRELLVGERLAVDLGVDERGDEVVAGVPAAVLGELLRELRELGAGGQQLRDDLRGIAAAVLGIARAEDDVGAVEDEPVLALRDRGHVADDLERERRGDLGDEVALALLDDGVDDRLGGARHVGLDPVDHAGREAARHDAAQSRVARVVHVDHRAEELVEGGRHVADVRALTGAEEFGLARHFEDVGVLGHRPEARAARQDHDLGLLVPRDRALAPQRCEGAFALLEGPRPEGLVCEPDLVDRDDLAGLHGTSSGTGARFGALTRGSYRGISRCPPAPRPCPR